MAFTLPYYMNYILKSQRQLTSEGPDLYRIVTVQTLLKTIHLLCITVSVGRSRSVKNAADTKLFASPGLAKSKYRRFSRPTSTAMHKMRPKNQAGLNCNNAWLTYDDVGIKSRESKSVFFPAFDLYIL
jgi:hypothetical protein